MSILKNAMRSFENAMVALTFAEAGEFETARRIMREEKRQEKILLQQKRETMRQISPQIR